MDIFIFGDSITWGAWDTEGGWATRLKKSIDEKIIKSNFTYYHAVHLLGVSGDTTRNLLSRLEQEIDVRTDERESLMIVAIGINDSAYISNVDENVVPIEEFKKNLHLIKNIAERKGSNLVFVGLTPVDFRVDPMEWWPEASYKMEYVKAYNEVLSHYCDENNLLFIDLLSKLYTPSTEDMLIDGVHPNSNGHEMISTIVKESLSKIL